MKSKGESAILKGGDEKSPSSPPLSAAAMHWGLLRKPIVRCALCLFKVVKDTVRHIFKSFLAPFYCLLFCFLITLHLL